MKTIISGRNIQLTDAIKTTVQEKIHKINEHYDFVQEVHVFLSVEKNPRIAQPAKAEATVHVSGATLRIEVSSEDLYASIDLLVDKLDRSLSRYKTKLLGRNKASRSAGGETIRHLHGVKDVLEAPVKPAHTATDEDEFEVMEGAVWITGEVYETPLEPVVLKTGTR
jgi:putative sigma-54 modulation protein